MIRRALPLPPAQHLALSSQALQEGNFAEIPLAPPQHRRAGKGLWRVVPCGPSRFGDHWTVVTGCPCILPDAAGYLTVHSRPWPGTLLSSLTLRIAGVGDLSCRSCYVITKFNFPGDGMFWKEKLPFLEI